MLEQKISFMRKNSPHRERGTCVVIPNIPKLLDERGRTRLFCDYEKYEAELFKHHIGTPDTTRTIGIKQFPEEFDRRVPLPNEPTLAERAWEARKGRWKALKQAPAESVVKLQPVKRSAANVQAAQVATEAEQEGLAPETLPSVAILSLPQENQQQLISQQQRKRQQRDAESAKLLRQATLESKARDAAIKEETKATNLLAVPRSENLESKTPMFSPRSTQSNKGKSRNRDIRQKLLEPIQQLKTNVSVDVSLSSPNEKGINNWDAEYCGRLLSVLLDPPVGYDQSFYLDLGNIDLRWMYKNRYPKNFVTLHTWRGNEEDDAATSINSPRSVIVLLRNGIAVKDLIRNTFVGDLSLPQDPETRRIVKNIRTERFSRRCEAFLKELRKEYAELCRNVGLADLLAEFHRWGKEEEPLELPTTIKVGYERQERIFKIEQRRLEKQMAAAKELHERQLSAERRQKQQEQDALLKTASKKEEERIARERVAERLAVQQKKKAEMEAFYLKELQERQARAEELQARRVEAQQRLKEIRHENSVRRAEERKRRLERVAERKVKEGQELQHKQELKEERLRRLREEQERLREENHAKMLAKAAKSAELRQLAREKAALHIERLFCAAMEQQQKVEERLSRFHQEREEERAKRLQQGEQKRAYREQAFIEAANKLDTFKKKVMEKHMQQEMKYEDMLQQRQLETLTRLEQDNAEREQKIFSVQRKRRMDEFGKLSAVLRLLSKVKTAELIERQRNLLLSENRKAREATQLNMTTMKEGMASKIKIAEPK